MWHSLRRGALLALVFFVYSLVPASAAEVTLTLKGGDGFRIVGELKAFDGKKYIIINPSFGRMEVDSSRFDCISPECPTGPIKAVDSPSFLFGRSKTEFAVAGSSAIGSELMPAIIKAYGRKLKLNVTAMPGATASEVTFGLADGNGRELAAITLRRGASQMAFQALRSKSAVIGMSSRAVAGAEAGRLSAAGFGNVRSADREHVIGLDGLVILTATENPAISMSVEDVAKVFSGQIKDWGQLGFPPGEIQVYAPVAGSGTWEAFEALVLTPRNLQLVSSAQRVEEHADQSDRVAGDPLGIGVVGFAFQRNAKALNMEASCGLITPASNFSIKTEEYPLSRRLYLYSARKPKPPLAADLLSFALSPGVQSVIKEAGFVDQAAELIGFKEQGSRVAHALNAPQGDFDLGLMRTFLTDLKGAERLTYTFRFKTASFSLDNKSKQNVARLSELMSSPLLRNKSIKLIGFADTEGSFQTNLTLSLSRAEAVRSAILRAGKGRIETSRLLVKGYGELAPVACNDTRAGKSFNRRVEVWVDRDQ